MTQLEGTAVLGVAIGEGDVDAELDRALVVRAQAGDTAAFGQLYLRYHRRICRLAERRLHDRHEAEDVTQEAFTRAWRALPTFGGERAFYPWLAVITVHLCTDVVRHRRHAAAHTGSLDRVAPPTEGADAGVETATDHRIVAGAFDRLSSRHQRILRLREDSGWSYARIAEHEGLGLHAVEALLWRARQALKREYLALAQDRLGAVAGAGIVAWATLRRLAALPRRLARPVAAATGRLAAAMGPASASVLVAVGVGLPAAPVVMAVAAHAGAGAAPSSPAPPPPSSPSVGGGGPGPTTGAVPPPLLPGAGPPSSTPSADPGAPGGTPRPGARSGPALGTTVHAVAGGLGQVLGATGGVVSGATGTVAGAAGSLAGALPQTVDGVVSPVGSVTGSVVPQDSAAPGTPSSAPEQLLSVIGG